MNVQATNRELAAVCFRSALVAVRLKNPGWDHQAENCLPFLRAAARDAGSSELTAVLTMLIHALDERGPSRWLDATSAMEAAVRALEDPGRSEVARL